jgi:hypothetical protein
MKLAISLTFLHLASGSFQLEKKNRKNSTSNTMVLPFAENLLSLVPQLPVGVPGVADALLMQVDLGSNQTSVTDVNCIQSLDGLQKSCRSAPTYLYSQLDYSNLTNATVTERSAYME